jgi:hypothetical protein
MFTDVSFPLIILLEMIQSHFKKGKRVRDGPPKRQTGEDIMRQHRDIKPAAGGGFEGYGE